MSNYPDDIVFSRMPQYRDYKTSSPEQIAQFFKSLSVSLANAAKAAVDGYQPGGAAYASRDAARHFEEALECAFEELIDESKKEREE